MRRCYGCMKEYDEKYDVCPYCGYVAGTEPEVKSHLNPGTLLSGRYAVGKAIGHGGFGITYIAWDKKIKKVVAVKEYFPNAFSTRSAGETQVSCFNAKGEMFLKEGIKKMLDEAERLSSFSRNDNIVDIFDYFEENNTAYIVMEYLEGKDLKKYIEENGDKLAPEKAVELILPVLNALEDMHKEKLIHRDISPDNIFLCNNGKVKLLDFGSARLAVEDSNKSLSVMVKRGYAPKEQYASRSKQGPWTDVYSVCATLYRMITGQTPVESTEREDESLVNFRQYGITEYDALERVIFKGLEVEYTNRIGSVQELREMLLNPEEKAPETAVSSPAETKKKINVKAIIAAVAAVVVVIGVVFGVKFFGKNPDKEAEPVNKVEVELNEGEAKTIYETFLASDDLKNINPTVNAFLKKDISLLPQEKKVELELETLGIKNLDSSIVKNEYRDFDNDGVEELLLSLDINGKGSRMSAYLFDIGAGKKVFEGVSWGCIAPDENHNHISVMQENSDFYFVEFSNDGEKSRNYVKSVYDGEKLDPVYSLSFPDHMLKGCAEPDFAYCETRGKSLCSPSDREFEYPAESEITSITYDEAFEASEKIFEGKKIAGFCDDSWDNWKKVEVAESGELDGGIKWTLYQSGYLMIEGTGKMPNFDVDAFAETYDHRPWNDLKDKIVSIGVLKGITYIGCSAFSDLPNLKNVFILNGVTNIAESAFFNCDALSVMTVPDSVTTIGKYAFSYCENLVDIKLSENIVNIGEYVFQYCEKLKSIAIPNGVLNLETGTFSYCRSLESVIIPQGVMNIADYTFEYCESLKTVTLPESIATIDEYAFLGSGLVGITIPSNVHYIGYEAFSSCSNLLSVSVDNKNKSYLNDEYGVLLDKTKTEVIHYPAGNERTSYVVTDSVRVISQGSFAGSKNLTDITLPDSLITIGESAFNGSGITSVIIPDGVENIFDRAFLGCDNLENVTIPGGVSYIGDAAFSRCDNLESVTIQDGVANIGEGAFYYCDSLVRITIPDSVNDIADSAFSGCTKLDDVYYQGSQTQWRAITVGDFNEDLTNAKIHYKNSGLGLFD